MIPKVTFLMTCFNAETYIKATIDSILAQTYCNFKVLIVENGSTDLTLSILNSFNDPRIEIIELEKNIGRTPALNLGLKHIDSQFVAIHDADDISCPQRLEKQVSWMKSHQETVLLAGWCKFIDLNDNEIGTYQPPINRSDILNSMTHCNPISHSSVLFRKEAAKRGYPEDFIYAQDFALWLSMQKEGEIDMLEDFIVKIRQHPEAVSNNISYALAKSWDGMRLYEEALKISGISKLSYKKGLSAIAIEMARYGKSKIKTGQFFSGILWLVKAFYKSPRIFFFQKIRNTNFYQGKNQ
ncbi:MAG: glycosyltransferase [Methylocystaceae bacterium]|nr:glycosyltransferase [Methylocystaceae bacterium]